MKLFPLHIRLHFIYALFWKNNILGVPLPRQGVAQAGLSAVAFAPAPALYKHCQSAPLSGDIPLAGQRSRGKELQQMPQSLTRAGRLPQTINNTNNSTL